MVREKETLVTGKIRFVINDTKEERKGFTRESDQPGTVCKLNINS